MEAPGLDFGGFWDAQVAPGWPQGLQISCKMLSKTAVFGRSNLNAKNFDFGMHPFAFPQKAWPRLGGGGVPPWGPSIRRPPKVCEACWTTITIACQIRQDQSTKGESKRPSSLCRPRFLFPSLFLSPGAWGPPPTLRQEAEKWDFVAFFFDFLPFQIAI